MTIAGSLKDALARWPGLPKLERQFEPRLARAAAVKVLRQLEDVEPKAPAPHDLDALYWRISESWSRHRSLDNIAPRDFRRLPWVLFYSPCDDARSRPDRPAAWLGADPDLVTACGGWLARGRPTRAVRALLHEFLHVYPVELPTFEDWRKLLRMAVENCPTPVPPALSKRQRQCREFGLVDPNGDLTLVRKLVESDGDMEQLLQDAGLGAGLSRCGFLKSGIRRYLSEFGSRSARNAAELAQLERLLQLLECEGRLRFSERGDRVAAAAGLLGPFVDRPAESSTEQLLRPFFLRHFGHPHLPRDKGKWSGVPEEVRRVVMRWFVKLQLDRFFLLIRKTALDKHWRFREAFWNAFLRQGVIEEIWLVLGPNALQLLRYVSEQEGGKIDTHALSYGHLRGTGSQSILLIRLPGVTVAEWSHNGRCRFWLDGSAGTPRLYQTEYFRHQPPRGLEGEGVTLMKGEDFSQVHRGSENGSWQDKIARWLRDNTGLHIDRAEYVLNDVAQTPDVKWEQ